MKYEKSCGAVIYRNSSNTREYLLIMNKKGTARGHWGFPKGHIEAGENEFQTAAREIFEETGLEVVFCGGIREVSSYSPRAGVEKDVVYFLATPKNDAKIKLQAEEVAEYKWCSLSEAKSLLTYDKVILEKIERAFL